MNETKIIDYKIVYQTSFVEQKNKITEDETFSAQVRGMIAEGWQPFGQPFIVTPNIPGAHPFVCQAMVKYGAKQ